LRIIIIADADNDTNINNHGNRRNSSVGGAVY